MTTTSPKSALEPKLDEIFSTRNEKVMFVKGTRDVDEGEVAEVIDMGHQANVDNIGLITPRVEAELAFKVWLLVASC